MFTNYGQALNLSFLSPSCKTASSHNYSTAGILKALLMVQFKTTLITKRKINISQLECQGGIVGVAYDLINSCTYKVGHSNTQLQRYNNVEQNQ